MKISSEWTLINKLKDSINKYGIPRPDEIICDIGDDCSAFIINNEKYGLITTDISIENQHFRREFSPPDKIGAKAMCSNISDIAAMGGKPLFAFISIGIPEDLDEEYILDIYKGMTEEAASSEIFIAGGDTSKSQILIINIAIYGEVNQENLITRKGANRSDKIYITGTTGDSKAGLEILLENKNKKNEFQKLIDNHLQPTHRLKLVDTIIKDFKPTAMIDISDGILSDLNHICQSSSRGFVIKQDSLPFSDELAKYSNTYNKNIIDYSLNSGEEYELLFTSKKNIDQSRIKNMTITQIGEIIDSGYFIKHKDMKRSIKINGFNHFQKEK